MMDYPKVIATPQNTFKLLEDYIIGGVVIPKGEETDGLTLKVRLLRLLINKYEPRFQPFYFLHDYLTNKERYEEADDLGEKILMQIEDSWRTRFGMWCIRKYHKFKGVA